MIVGRFLGQKSLAAVGATSAIFDLIVGLPSVLAMGWGSLSRNYGAKTMINYENQSPQLAIGGILSLFVISIGVVGLYPLLQF